MVIGRLSHGPDELDLLYRHTSPLLTRIFLYSGIHVPVGIKEAGLSRKGEDPLTLSFGRNTGSIKLRLVLT